MSMSAMSYSFPVMGVRRRTIAAVAAVVAAVLLPQLFHVAGMAVGAGPTFAQSWLPMFVPVMLAGLLAGPVVGLIVGGVAPLVAFAWVGMPAVSMLPAMMVWLAVCGVVAGLISSRHLHPAWTTALVVGTAPVVSFMWMALTSLIAGSGLAAAATAWTTYWLTGLPGVALQLAAVAVTAIVIRRR